MKKIISLAALLSAIGSGAALAQGAPPGSPSWNNSWPGGIGTAQALALGTTATRPDGRAALARNGGSVPVAANPHGRSRGG